MIDVSVRAVKPHPDQATNNPGCWAVQLRISHAGRSRSFWRWYTKGDLKKKPTAEEIIERFWNETFAGLHGFDFETFMETA